MSALAGLLVSAGHAVSGSDTKLYPPTSDLLRRLPIKLYEGYSAEQLEGPIDVVVIGNAVSKSNPEVAAVLEQGIPYLSMPQALERYFLEGKEPLVVAGTHGKTTTASLLASVLISAGVDPGAMIGGWVANLDGNFRLGGGKYFVVEGDEYDTAFFDKGPKFFHYRPQHAILTSVEYDHADIYPSVDLLKSAFSKFVSLVPSDGWIIAGADEAVEEVTRAAGCRLEFYGPAGGNGSYRLDWSAEEIEASGRGTAFYVFYRGRGLGRVALPLWGAHNVKNALAVVALASKLGIPFDRIASGLLSFAGVKRRQEIVAEEGGITIIDDFAHHPTAVRETLASLRSRFPERRLWAIFEPRSATSRRRIFQREFAEALSVADRVVISGIFQPEKIPEQERLDPEEIAADIRKRNVPADFIGSAEWIAEAIVPQLAFGDVVVIMSSGGFGGLHKKLAERIGAKP